MSFPRVYRTFWGTDAPGSNGFGAAVVVANQYRFDVAGLLVGVRYWRLQGDLGWHFMAIRKGDTGELLRCVVFKTHTVADNPPDRWETAYFHPEIRLSAGDIWQLCLHTSLGFYAAMPGALASADLSQNGITAPQDTPSFFNGSYTYAADLVPSNQAGGTLYGVDPVVWSP
jgi:hypothetical protein